MKKARKYSIYENIIKRVGIAVKNALREANDDFNFDDCEYAGDVDNWNIENTESLPDDIFSTEYEDDLSGWKVDPALIKAYKKKTGHWPWKIDKDRHISLRDDVR